MHYYLAVRQKEVFSDFCFTAIGPSSYDFHLVLHYRWTGNTIV